MNSRCKALAFVLLIGSFMILNCRSLDVNLFPDSYDVNLGLQVVQEINTHPKEYPVMQGREDIKAYVEQVGRKVLASPEIKKRGVYAYQFQIIQDDKTVNAFCTPGGCIYVYTGLLKFVDNEAALAGVVAHEIAHAEKRHASRRMTGALAAQVGASAALDVILGKGSTATQKAVAGVISNLVLTGVLLKNSREDEDEADEYSMNYLRSTEYYPGAIRNFFDKILSQQDQQGKRGGTLERLLSDHPLPQDRVDAVNQRLQAMGNPLPTENNSFSQRYLQFKNTLP
jgi:predicted Zn-dependent protease